MPLMQLPHTAARHHTCLRHSHQHHLLAPSPPILRLPRRMLLHGSLLLGVQPAVLDGGTHAPDVLLHVLPVQLSSLGVGGAVRVGVVQETLDGSEDGGNIVRGGPSILEDIQAELAVRVHVRMEHAREELDGRWLVRIRLVKGQHELECAVFEGRVHCNQGVAYVGQCYQWAYGQSAEETHLVQR